MYKLISYLTTANWNTTVISTDAIAIIDARGRAVVQYPRDTKQNSTHSTVVSLTETTRLLPPGSHKDGDTFSLLLNFNELPRAMADGLFFKRAHFKGGINSGFIKLIIILIK